MTELPQQLPPEATEAWRSYQELKLAKHRHKVVLSNPISDEAGVKESLRHHEQCIASFRQATKDLQQSNLKAHAEFLNCLATEPDT